MPLNPGARLGPYEIVGPLGAGGMGEVYRARDTRLNRDVAVKILPDHLAANPDVKARFEREARAVSSLNHPNICTLHDIGRHEGVDYLVMECLEGETLAARLEKGPLPMEETLRVGIEIAGALHAAHRQGIVHRDLKPGNIMLTRAGAKLLDFGLARSGGLAATASSLTMSPTLAPAMTHPLTAEGTIVGTFQYMAPEQLEGHETDARTDLFAFGAVLYEMVTGRRAFDGKSHASLIGLIMSSQPPAMKDLAPVTPLALERLVRSCMAKSPDDRCQSAHDVLLQLKWIAEGPGAEAAQVSSAAPGKGVALWRAAAILFAVLAIGVGVASILSRPDTPAPAAMRLQIMPPGDIDWRPWNSMAISPDGMQFVFYGIAPDGTDGLWYLRLDSFEARRLSGTEKGNSGFAFWSPDSQSIGFFAGGKLKTLQINGAAPVVLCEATDGRGGTWGPDGTIVFSPFPGSPLLRVPASGGVPEPVTALEPSEAGGHAWPAFLNDGKHFTFLAIGENRSESWLSAASLDKGPTKRLTGAGSGAFHDPSGYLVFQRDGALLAQRFDLATLSLTDSPQLVASAVSRNKDSVYTAFSLSRTGTLLYRGGADSTRQLAWFNREGRRFGETIDRPGDVTHPDLAPDGQRVVIRQRDFDALDGDLWILDLKRMASSRFTFGGGDVSDATWSGDGKRIYYSAKRGGKSGIYARESNGSEEEKLILAPDETGGVKIYLADVSRDGRYLSYEKRAEEKSDLWVLPLIGGGAPSAIVATKFDEWYGRFSPDGRWVAYTSDESGRSEIYVRALLRPGGKWQVSTSGGVQARWRADGKELFYLGLDRQLTAVPIEVSGETLITGIPQPLFITPLPTISANDYRYAPAPDGQSFLVVTPSEGMETQPTMTILNWPSTLRGTGG